MKSALLTISLLALLPVTGYSENFTKFRGSGASRPDAAKMISVLQGRAKASTHIARPSVIGAVLERKSKLAAEAAPKGLPTAPVGGVYRIKSGRAPAESAPVEPDSKTLYMKKGNLPAEGIATAPLPSQPSPVKAGRVPAEGEPIPPRPRPSKPSGSHLLAGGLPGYGGGGGHRAAPALPTEISYRVDASSQLSTDTVKFVKGSTELADQGSYDYLITLAEALRSSELGGERFVVEGHASAEGSDDANHVLSQRRANAIFDFLASRGVAADRLLAVGHGESQARFADHEPEFLRAQDRQVVVFKLAE